MKNLVKKLLSERRKRKIRILRSKMAALFYGKPAEKLKFIGVTGTSGKSTTTTMIYHILNECGYKVGVISTLGAKAGNKIMDTGYHVTTPDPEELQKILSYMVKKGIEYVVLETSSHALAQGRLGTIVFDYSVFTNIKRDHLDWHGSWENYALAKAELIDRTKENGVVVINRGDKESYEFLNNYIKQKHRVDDLKILTYSISELTDIAETTEGVTFNYAENGFFIPVLGRYNIENSLAAVNVAQSIGLSFEQIAYAFRTFKGLEGRMQVITMKPFTAIVDFAHNTDSLQRSLETARALTPSKNKLILVFGSAGLRDVEKRYTMGEVAANMADIIIITAEDPRTEKLKNINDQILEGIEKGGATLFQRFKNHEEYLSFNLKKSSIPKKSVIIFDEENVQNRFDAIDFAVKIAEEGDVVITQGKGHEQSLCFGTTEYPFTDQEAVRKALQANEYKKEVA